MLLQRLLPNGPESANKSLKKADEFLVQHGEVGIIIGGIAHGIYAGETDKQLEAHKDLDILVISDGKGIENDKDFDLFRPRGKGGYLNRNGAALPYHVHYIGEELTPGLRVLPLEAVQLIEIEQKTRRALERVAPDLLKADDRKQFNDCSLDLEDIILEFPGETRWFGAKLPKDVQLYVYRQDDEELGSRTFVSFTPLDPNNLPKTAFPDSKKLRSPEFESFDDLPAAELTPEQAFKLADTYIQQGFLQQGMEYIAQFCPENIDDKLLIKKITEKQDEQPIEVLNALMQWISIAKRQKSILLFLNHPDIYNEFGISNVHKDEVFDFEKIFKTIMTAIIEKYGARYKEIVEKLATLDLAKLFGPAQLHDAVKQAMKKGVIQNCVSVYINNYSSDDIRILQNDKECSFAFDLKLNFPDEDDPEIVGEELYALMNRLGITKDELRSSLVISNISISDDKIDKSLLKKKLFKDDELTLEDYLKAELERAVKNSQDEFPKDNINSARNYIRRLKNLMNLIDCPNNKKIKVLQLLLSLFKESFEGGEIADDYYRIIRRLEKNIRSLSK